MSADCFLRRGDVCGRRRKILTCEKFDGCYALHLVTYIWRLHHIQRPNQSQHNLVPSHACLPVQSENKQGKGLRIGPPDGDGPGGRGSGGRLLQELGEHWVRLHVLPPDLGTVRGMVQVFSYLCLR